MRVVLCETPLETGKVAADILARHIKDEPCVIGLATGSSPIPVYEELIRQHREEGLSFARCTAFTLDEYVGLDPDDPRSYRATIREVFADHVDLTAADLYSPGAAVTDHESLRNAAAEYETQIAKSGGIDVQLLGIGANGHIGFNEPTSSLRSRTRIKVLTEQTRRDNARFFDSYDEVPRLCLTQGLGTILDSSHAVMVAQGESKAAAVAAAVEGPLSAQCPASVLQLHARATVILDAGAASQLKHLDYYRHSQLMSESIGLLP